MQRKINLTQVICLWMGKTTETKPYWVNLKSPLLRIHYYQNKRLQVKGISVPNTNLQLNIYPNTQLNLWCSDNLSFQYTAPSTWLTNWCTDSSTWLTHQLEKDLATKFFGSFNDESQETPWLQNSWRKDAVASTRNMMN